MPSTIKPRRGATAPTTGLVQDELAVDTTNKRIYIGNVSGAGDLIGSAPGGSNTYVQFNDSGNFGGDLGLSYNKTTDTLTVEGELFVNGGALRTTAATFNVANTNATTLNLGGSATNISAGSATCTTTISGGTLLGSTTTQNLFNTVATTLNVGGAATILTMGATSGTAAIRNSTLRLGNTTSNITTNTGSTNNINIIPQGKLVVAPDSSVAIAGSFPSLTVENTDQASGVVEISGGDLYLGRKTVDDFAYTAVSIGFEGSSNDTNETTLTVADPTADRTITLPNLTGTVALVAGSDTQVMFNDGGSAIGGDSGLTYNKTTDVLTVSGAVVSSGGYRINSSAINAQVDNYTLQSSDNGKIITVSAGSVKSITVPTGLDVGFNCTIMRIGTGRVTFTASSTTINSVDGLLEIASQHGAASLLCYSSNTFNLSGNLG